MQAMYELSVIAVCLWLLPVVLCNVSEETVVVLHRMLWLPKDIVFAVLGILLIDLAFPLSGCETTEVQIDCCDSLVGTRSHLSTPEKEIQTVI